MQKAIKRASIMTAFYGQDSNDSSKIYDITGVSFVGTTTIEETAYGIQFGGTAADFTGLNVTIEDPKAPAVPNTGVSR